MNRLGIFVGAPPRETVCASTCNGLNVWPCKPIVWPCKPIVLGEWSEWRKEASRQHSASAFPVTSAAIVATVVGARQHHGLQARRRGDKRRCVRRAIVAQRATETSCREVPDLDEDLRELGEWCAMVINLARRPDRMQQVEELLSNTNPRLLRRLERLEAVDGKTLSLDDEVVRNIVDARTLDRARRAKELGIYSVVHDDSNMLVHFDDHFTEGAIACAMSHHKALERVASHPTADWGLILEDDNSVVVPNVDRAIARILRQLPPDWDAVYLGYHHDDGKPHPAGLRTAKAAPPVKAHGLASEATLSDEFAIVDVPVREVHNHCWGLFAWMIKKEAAKELVQNLFPINTQVDGAISGWLVRNRGAGRVFCVPPEQLLFYSSCSEEGQDSDIQTLASEDSVVEKFGSWTAYKDLDKQPSVHDDMYLHQYFGDDQFKDLENLSGGPPLDLEFDVVPDKDCFSGDDVHVMSASDLDTCKRLCAQRGYGAFIVYEGMAYFREQTSQSCRANLEDAVGATIYLRLGK